MHSAISASTFSMACTSSFLVMPNSSVPGRAVWAFALRNNAKHNYNGQYGLSQVTHYFSPHDQNTAKVEQILKMSTVSRPTRLSRLVPHAPVEVDY